MVGRSATLAPAMGASHDDSRRPQHREEVISTTPWGFFHELRDGCRGGHLNSRRPQHREEVISTTPWGFPHELRDGWRVGHFNGKNPGCSFDPNNWGCANSRAFRHAAAGGAAGRFAVPRAFSK